MADDYSFDTLLMIGVVKALKERGLITEEELNKCILKIESEEKLC
ncbi:MAG: hypothetical protein PUF72_02850 [Clostridiales bacterium]|nr:hypothetical protein [Clostridiales bacterium]